MLRFDTDGIARSPRVAEFIACARGNPGGTAQRERRIHPYYSGEFSF
jgi:hypothetical protein